MAEENGTQLGKAYVQIVPSMQGLASELRRAFGDSMPDGHKFGSSLGGKVVSGFGSTIKKGFALAAKAGIATISAASAGIGAIVKSSASAYADYEQNIGGVETLFKDNADTIVKYASEAYKTAGISANDYMQNVTSFSASLLQGLGGDTAQAAEIANEAMVDMSDNANKFGTDISSIQNAYQGFAKQNYTMLDNLKLGYGGTQAEMARLINDSGVLGDSIKVDEKTVNSVSFDKMIEAIHKVQTDLDITGTTSKEAATTVSGSLGSVKAAWANLMAGMGDKNADLKNLIKEMVGTVKTFAKNILPVIKQALSGVTTLISELAPDIAAELPQLVSDLLPQLIEAGTQIFQALVKGISDNTIKRSSLTKYKNILLKSNNYQAIDFYTGKVLQENDISVDHVIPWSFMYSDDIWNLVLTSKSNNSSKSNIIPSQGVIESLKERNVRLVKLINDSKYKDELLLAIENDYVDKFYLAMKI